MSYVPPEVFEAISMPPRGAAGLDWQAAVSADEWREHERRLESVIDALQFAESQP